MKKEGGVLALALLLMALAAFVMQPRPAPRAAFARDAAAPRVIVHADGARIDLNLADAPLLEELPGIGPSLARAILSYRDEHGPFTSVEALRNVPGVGPARLEQIRDRLTVVP